MEFAAVPFSQEYSQINTVQLNVLGPGALTNLYIFTSCFIFAGTGIHNQLGPSPLMISFSSIEYGS